LHFAVREFQARALAAYQLAEEKLAGAERERCARRSRALMAPEKTPLAGGDRGDRFEEAKDVSQARGILVGLRLWLRQVGTGQAVAALQPVFRVPGGEAPGVVRGPREGGDLEAIARQGYAVAGIVAASDGRRLAGLRVVFHRVRGGRLDPRDSYESEWIGGKGVGKEVALGGTGAVAVGIHGLQGAEGATVGALGLVLDAPRSSQ
jgi:hypothetical protein